MALKFATPLAQVPFLTDIGTVSPVWYLFFSSIVQTVGGPNVVAGGGVEPMELLAQLERTPPSNIDAVDALRGVDELRNQIASIRSTDDSVYTMIDELRNELAAARSTYDSFSAMIDELRNELSSARNDAVMLRTLIDELSSLTVLPTIDQFRNRIESIEDRLA